MSEDSMVRTMSSGASRKRCLDNNSSLTLGGTTPPVKRIRKPKGKAQVKLDHESVTTSLSPLPNNVGDDAMVKIEENQYVADITKEQVKKQT